MGLLAVAGFLLLVLYATGGGRRVDDRFADLMARAWPAGRDRAPVVLVRIDSATLDLLGPLPWSEETVERLLGVLETHRPRRAVLASSPDLLLERPEAARARRSWLVVPAFDAGQGGPAQVTRFDADGMARHLYPYRGPGTAGPAWEWEVAGRTPGNHPVGIRFSGPPGTLPNVSARDVVTDSVPSGLIEDRYVVIGLDVPGLVSYVPSPVATADAPMTEAELHANALATVLEDRWLHEMGPLGTALLLASVLIGLWFVFCNGTVSRSLRLSVLIVGCAIASFVFAYVVTDWLLPLFGILTAVAMAFLVAAWHRAVLVERVNRGVARRIVRALSLRLPGRAGNDPVELDVWNQLVGFATAHLDPVSQLLARPSADGMRLRYTQYHGTTPADVRERRTDLSRFPWCDALAGPTVLRVEKFMNADGVVTYIVPLVYPARLRGLWVVNLRPGGIAARRMELLMAVGRQAARLLAQEPDLDGGPAPSSTLADAIDASAQLAGEIDRSVDHLVREKNLLSLVLDGLRDGVLLSDMFGRVLHLNRPMADVLAAFGLVPDDVPTLADLLRGLKAPRVGGDAGWLMGLDPGLANRFVATASSSGRRFEFLVRVLRSDAQAGDVPDGFLVTATASGAFLGRHAPTPNGHEAAHG